MQDSARGLESHDMLLVMQSRQHSRQHSTRKRAAGCGPTAFEECATWLAASLSSSPDTDSMDISHHGIAVV